MKNAGKTILFVEDNPLVITIYQNWLQREGFQVDASNNGLDAIEKLPRVKPSLVILDLMLPMLDGLDVLKFIRTSDSLKETPVLILSNAYMDDQAAKAMKAGANKLLLKTQCTPARLIQAVRELLDVETQAAHPSAQSKLAVANETLLKETRETFLNDAPAEIAKIREHCLAFVKNAGTNANAEHLNNLYQRVRFLCARAGLGDCTRIAHLASALEATLFEIMFKKSVPSASALQTIAQAVDCLGRLFQSKQWNSFDVSLKSKVLIVDDDPVCNFVNAAAMKRAKLEAVSVDNPAAALELAEKGEIFDIVLLDINMPGMNGFEVCERLRALRRYQKTPVIFVTSNSEFQNRAQAVLSGGNDLIAKPISPLELALKTIMHLIEPREHADKSVNSKNRAALAGTIELRMENSSDANLNARPKMEPPAKFGNGHTDFIKHRNAPIKMPAMPTETKISSPALFTTDTEHLPVNRIHSPKNGDKHQMLMKNENPNSSPVEKIAAEVSHIIFDSDTASEMQLRLTRIALEHYEVPQIMAHPNGEAFKKIVPEIGRIIFGDEKLSEMQLRLTRLALERYGVHQIVSASVEPAVISGTNGHDHASSRTSTTIALGAL